MQAVKQLCDRCVLLTHGKVEFDGHVHKSISIYTNKSESNALSNLDLKDYPRLFELNGAKILCITIQDSCGQEIQERVLERNKSLKICVRFDITHELKSFDIAIAIFHSEGFPIFSEWYSDINGKQKISTGTYEIDFEIPLKYFKLDFYFLTISINDSGKHCDSIEKYPLPEIVEKDFDPVDESRRGGIVRLPGIWKQIKKL
jgi:hypothetical protein